MDIQALAVATEILEVIQRSETRISAAQIARELQMTPPRVGRYLSTMQSLGLIETLPGERGYSLGWKLIRLGQSAIDKISLTEVAHADAEQLRNTIQDGVYVTIPYKTGANVIIFLRGRSPVALHIPLGMYYEGHASASGRVTMAFAEETRRTEFLSGFLDSETYPDPICDPLVLNNRYVLIRERMYDVAFSISRHQGTYQQIVTGIAAPIFSINNNIAGTIGIMSSFVGPEEIQSKEVIHKLCTTAANISRSLGGTLWDKSK